MARAISLVLELPNSAPTPSNVEALLGLRGVVVVPLRDGHGQVRLANGETWTARLADAFEHAEVGVGARLTVVGIDGATAVVAPAAAPTTPGIGVTP